MEDLEELIEAVEDYLQVLNGRGMFDGYGIAARNKEKIIKFKQMLNRLKSMKETIDEL